MSRQKRPAKPRPKRPLQLGARGPAGGTQPANVGYWQAVGSTRAAAKRSKRA